MTLSPLQDTRFCPRADHCEVCGAGAMGDLWLETFQAPEGIYCITLCLHCCAHAHPEVGFAGDQYELVLDHCGHLGMSPTQMRVLFEAEQVLTAAPPSVWRGEPSGGG